MRQWKSVVAGILIAFGAFLALGVFVGATKRGWNASDTALWWIFVAAPIGGGVAWLASGWLSGLQHREAELADDVIAAARSQGGVLTAADLVQATSLTLDQAEATLHHLAARGHLTPTLTDDGVMQFGLPGGASRRSRPVTTPPRQASTLDPLQIAARRRFVRIFTGGVLVGLVLGSVFLSLAGPRLWPIR